MVSGGPLGYLHAKTFQKKVGLVGVQSMEKMGLLDKPKFAY